MYVTVCEDKLKHTKTLIPVFHYVLMHCFHLSAPKKF